MSPTVPLSDHEVRRQVLLDEIDASLRHLQPLHDRCPDLDLSAVIGALSSKRHELAYSIQQEPPGSQLADNGRWISTFDDPSFYRFDMDDEEWHGR